MAVLALMRRDVLEKEYSGRRCSPTYLGAVESWPP